MNNPTIPEIRIESLDTAKETKPDIYKEETPQRKARENALPISIIIAALVLITVSLALHTSLFAMAANQLRTMSATEVLMQMILPDYTVQPIEDDSDDLSTDDASYKTLEETQTPAPVSYTQLDVYKRQPCRLLRQSLKQIFLPYTRAAPAFHKQTAFLRF